jgi:mRNA interferase MazF
MPRRYIPHRGDFVWLQFNPQAGREQAGRRPALILSPLRYNEKVGLALACPVTSKVKAYPFEVPVPDGLEVEGAILSDQIRNIDWKQRKAKLISRAPDQLINEVLARIYAILEYEP